MIEVEIQYTNIKNKKGLDIFYYKSVLVKGHANNINNDENKKLCAGITSIVQGAKYILDEYNWYCKCESGLFELVCNKYNPYKRKGYELARDNYQIDFMICQLYVLYTQYPSQFLRFDFIDMKKEGKDD